MLVHGPPVGPSVWRRVAEELETRGHRVVVPDVAGVPDWQAAVEAVRTAAARLAGPAVLVGYSAAGSLLAGLTAALPAGASAIVCVDGRLPAATGDSPTGSEEIRLHLEPLAVDGILPPWTEWWEPELYAGQRLDPELRALVEADLKRLPLAYYEGRVPPPPGWDDVPCGYLLLTREWFREDADEARRRGWRVEEIPEARHFHVLVDPHAVADALLRLSRG